MSRAKRKRRRLLMRRKRTLDPSIVIDYKRPDNLKRFVTERGKIIPARISGATATQQRAITTAVKRARYLALLPLSVAHRTERGFAGEMQLAASSMSVGMRDRRPPPRDRDGGDRDRGGDRGDRGGDRDRGGDSSASSANQGSDAPSADKGSQGGGDE